MDPLPSTSNAIATGGLDLRLKCISLAGDESVRDREISNIVSQELNETRPVIFDPSSGFRDDWFSRSSPNTSAAGGQYDDEHSYTNTEKYVQEKVGHDFGHSTDSSDEDDIK